MNAGVVAFVVTAVAVPLLLSEFGDWCPWIASCIVRWAARRLRDPISCQRYEEEWIANLNEVPGRFMRLIAALGYLACLPSMRQSVSRSLLNQGAAPVPPGPLTIRPAPASKLAVRQPPTRVQHFGGRTQELAQFDAILDEAASDQAIGATGGGDLGERRDRRGREDHARAALGAAVW